MKVNNFLQYNFPDYFKASNTGLKFLLQTKTGKGPFWYGNLPVTASFIQLLEHIHTIRTTNRMHYLLSIYFNN